jgi:predicted transcriptional regulator
MKVTCDPRQITVSQTNLAKALGITNARVSQLIKEGVVFRDDEDKGGAVMLVKSVQSYTAYKGVSASSETEDVDYMEEKGKHEKVKRELAELRLAKEEARAYDAKTVELVMIEMLSNLRTQLLGLPSKLAPIVEHKSKEEVYERLTEEIEAKLAELSEYSPEMFTSEVVEAGDGDEDG